MRIFIFTCILVSSCLWAEKDIAAADRNSGIDNKAPTLTSPEEGRQSLSLGWKYFSDGDYQFAANSFTIAKKYPESSLDARFGLGLSLMKLEKKNEALEEFVYLVDKGYKTSEVLPPMMWLLIEQKKYATAGKYLRLARAGKQKREWASLIRTGSFTGRAEAAMGSGDGKKLKSAVRDNYALLDTCQAPYVFFNSAKSLASAGMRNDAIDIHYDILKNCLDNMELRELSLRELRPLVSTPIIIERLSDERKQFSRDKDYMRKLDAIESTVLMSALEGLDPSSEKAYSIVRRINELAPGDSGMTARMAWDSLNLKHYGKAEEIFSSLLAKSPDKAEYALGLSYSLLALKRYQEVLPISEKFMDKADDFKMIRLNAQKGMGRTAYNSKSYKKAIEHYSAVLIEEPGNSEALSLIVWSHYNSGDFKKALPYFTKEYKNSGNPDNILPILSIYENTDSAKAESFTEELVSSGRPENVKGLADYYQIKGRPITAAQVTDEGPEACYYSADKPRVEMSFSTRNKSGDPGLSKLIENRTSLSASVPVRNGREISISVSHISLDSEAAPGGVFAGSFYNTGGVPDPDGMTNSASLVETEIRYRKEGRISYSVAIGMSPSEGEASASPAFSLETGTSGWRVELYRTPVRESILSYSGARDPYSSGWWGGVLKSGINASVISNPSARYVYSLSAGYDSYEGEKVIDNHSYNGTVSASRSYSASGADYIIGAFLTGMSFSRNTNHFTIGHGGYFSPQSFYAVGPSLRIMSKPCRTLWYDIDASVSYMNHKTDPSPHYPLNLSQPQGLYAGDSFSGMGASFRAGVRKLLSKSWSAGLSVSADSSSEYDQWNAGVSLRYLAGGRSTVLP